MNNPVNAFGRNSGGVDQFPAAIPDTDGKGSFVKERLRAIVPERRFAMQTLKRFKGITRSVTRCPASLHSFIYVGDAIATPYAYGRIIK